MRTQTQDLSMKQSSTKKTRNFPVCRDIGPENGTELRSESEDQLRYFLDLIRDVFDVCQERQKSLLAMLISAEVLRAMDADPAAGKVLRKYTFCSGQILRLAGENGIVPTNKDTGEMLGLSEQSVSRTYRGFREKVRSFKEDLLKTD